MGVGGVVYTGEILGRRLMTDECLVHPMASGTACLEIHESLFPIVQISFLLAKRQNTR